MPNPNRNIIVDGAIASNQQLLEQGNAIIAAGRSQLFRELHVSKITVIFCILYYLNFQL